jgi:hypothetical protein
MPRGPFTTESKKSDLKAASSGRSFAVRRKLSFSERTALKNSCHPIEAPEFSVFERKQIAPVGLIFQTERSKPG